MQLQFRIDDTNYVTIDLQLQTATLGGPATGPEVLAAVVTDSKLSRLSHDQLLDLVGQVVDYFSRSQEGQKTSADWFEEEWLPATRN